ncbi:hypothetical protein MKX03_004150, partial [Papaver bracteatum]
MAKIKTESPALTAKGCWSDTFGKKWGNSNTNCLRITRIQSHLISLTIRASQSMEDKNKAYKELEMLREYDLWDNVAKSNEILNELGDTTRSVDALKDLRYKDEEAKLITQLADMDAINYRLFKQAYNASVDVSKFLDRYEMSKHLSGPYDMEGACVIIRAGSRGVNPEKLRSTQSGWFWVSWDCNPIIVKRKIWFNSP